MVASLSALCEQSHYKLVYLNFRSITVRSYSFNSHWTMVITIFQEKSNTYHNPEPITGRVFPNLVLVRSFGATYAPRLLSIISSAPSLYAKLRVPTPTYDVEGGAIFSKKSTFVFFDGAAWTPRLRSPSRINAPDKTQWFVIISHWGPHS